MGRIRGQGKEGDYGRQVKGGVKGRVRHNMEEGGPENQIPREESPRIN